MTKLNRWTLPECYMGAHWDGYFVFLSRNRDSDALTRANFDAAMRELGGERFADDDTELVAIVREGHWAVGWIEWIAIHESATAALAIAEGIAEALEDYPVVDEQLFSEYEQTEADEVWRNCFDYHERIAYIRANESQFEFRDFADLLGCVRGNYFAGYASELLN